VKRALASIAVIVIAVALSGCANEGATQEFYTPADGANGQAGDIAIRNVVVVSEEGGPASLIATFVTNGERNDSLRGVKFGDVEATLLPDGALPLPGGTPVSVGTGELRAETARLDAEPGEFTTVELTFADAPRATVEALVQAPVGIYKDSAPTPVATILR